MYIYIYHIFHWTPGPSWPPEPTLWRPSHWQRTCSLIWCIISHDDMWHMFFIQVYTVYIYMVRLVYYIICIHM